MSLTVISRTIFLAFYKINTDHQNLYLRKGTFFVSLFFFNEQHYIHNTEKLKNY